MPRLESSQEYLSKTRRRFQKGCGSALAGTGFTVRLHPTSLRNGCRRQSCSGVTYHGSASTTDQALSLETRSPALQRPRATLGTKLAESHVQPVVARRAVQQRLFSGQRLRSTTRHQPLRAPQPPATKVNTRPDGLSESLSVCMSGGFSTGSKNEIVGSRQAASGQEQIQDHQSGSPGLSLPVAQAL